MYEGVVLIIDGSSSRVARFLCGIALSIALRNTMPAPAVLQSTSWLIPMILLIILGKFRRYSFANPARHCVKDSTCGFFRKG
ncbi:hypothetical protein SAMN05216420_102115 [Nitrosospira sp. Nl5]|nr:hypothetical protein SAMN05216420_102115 [Nitrosospira sp. Nl5]